MTEYVFFPFHVAVIVSMALAGLNFTYYCVTRWLVKVEPDWGLKETCRSTCMQVFAIFLTYFMCWMFV